MARQRAEAERLRGLDAERARRTAEADALAGHGRPASRRRCLRARQAAAGGWPAGSLRAWSSSAFRRPPSTSLWPKPPLDESGADTVDFLLAPNPGEPPRPLARIASGGELSRVALAIKSVLAAADDTPTLIFDEVDAGIGGRSAEPVGRLLWRLARDHQVVCVTHLPQIAAYADSAPAHREGERRRPHRDPGRAARRRRAAHRAGRTCSAARPAPTPRWELPMRCSMPRVRPRQPRGGGLRPACCKRMHSTLRSTAT